MPFPPKKNPSYIEVDGFAELCLSCGVEDIFWLNHENSDYNLPNVRKDCLCLWLVIANFLMLFCITQQSRSLFIESIFNETPSFTCL
jgi:hypothetical protein